MIKEAIGEGWYNLMSEYLESDDFKKIGKFIQGRRAGFNMQVSPEQNDIFRAFKECPLDKTKCIVLGYEPYGKSYDNGLAFGYNGDGPLPKALNNIHWMYENEIWEGLDLMFDYSLMDFSKKGILMLNISLTVDNEGSHINTWKGFTMNLIRALAKSNPEIKYFFWDKRALVVKNLIKTQDNKELSVKPFLEIEALTDIKFK